GGDHGLAGGDILVRGDRSARRVEERSQFVADFAGKHPPAFFPGAHAASRPGIGVPLERVVDAAGHGSERVADEVSGALEDGELGAIKKQVVGHWNNCNATTGISGSRFCQERADLNIRLVGVLKRGGCLTRRLLRRRSPIRKEISYCDIYFNRDRTRLRGASEHAREEKDDKLS